MDLSFGEGVPPSLLSCLKCQHGFSIQTLVTLCILLGPTDEVTTHLHCILPVADSGCLAGTGSFHTFIP